MNPPVNLRRGEQRIDNRMAVADMIWIVCLLLAIMSVVAYMEYGNQIALYLTIASMIMITWAWLMYRWSQARRLRRLALVEQLIQTVDDFFDRIQDDWTVIEKVTKTCDGCDTHPHGGQTWHLALRKELNDPSSSMEGLVEVSRDEFDRVNEGDLWSLSMLP